jgi:Bacterial pre-peptidase C-terminal domain
MTRIRRRTGDLTAAAVATTIAVTLGLAAGLPSAAASTGSARATSAEREANARRADATATALGLQRAPKRATLAKTRAGANAADPLLGLLPDPAGSDLSYWKKALRTKAQQRAAQARRNAPKATVEPLLVDEQEPSAVVGGNDHPQNAQLISAFGTSSGRRPAARILGHLASGPSPFAISAEEDDGAIDLATDTGIGAGSRGRATATIGDGPHGSAGDGSGDFDYYTVTGRAGQVLSADVDTPASSPLDSVVILWDAAGHALAANDDSGSSLDSLLTFTLPADGDYYVSVVAYGVEPGDPFDSGSGGGLDGDDAEEGAYQVTLGLDTTDIDYYAVNLKAGDVLSGSLSGAGDRLTVLDPSRTEVFGSDQDFSGIYPLTSPLAGGGDAVVDHVAARSGTHYVRIEGPASTSYSLTLEAYRPGPQRNHVTQTIFLDFDGQRVNTAIFGGGGVSQLSPLSAFLGRWGIPANKENALIDRIISTFKENVSLSGTKIKVLNSRDDADPFGKPNVSRLIVGGTIAESGVDTIGISQSIDPGNYDTADTALILLDVVSAPVAEYPEASFNAYLTPASNRIRFVGTALGNVISHEAGHFLGNWHVDESNAVANLMDQGGNFPLLFGVGPDGVGGTSDDPDVDFGPDTLNPTEGFTGLEDTKARVKWGAVAP